MLKDEKIYSVKIRGVSPFIMHNSECANPQNEWARKMAPLKAKRKKTDQEIEEIADLSFLSCLYWSEEVDGLYIPTDNVRKMLLEAARALDQRHAKKQIVGVRYENHIGWPFEVKNRNSTKALLLDKSLRYFKIVTIQRSKVPSIRAKFSEWAFELNITIDTSIVNPETVESWFDYAGDRVGLGCRRPYAPTPGEYGRFLVEEFKEIKE